MRKYFEAEKLQFCVLYRQFLLRVVDLEALSTQADVIKLLGQFAAILVALSLIYAIEAFVFEGSRMTAAAHLAFCWRMEHFLIATTMLVVGLFALLSWDSTFPDRRDVMVLAPLPVRARTLFFAKVAALGTTLSLPVLVLNVASGLAWPLVLAPSGLFGIFRSLAAYWITMFAAATFLFCSILSVQGVTAQLLPRRYFLRLSAFLQLTTFALFLGVYFLQPAMATPKALTALENQRLLAWLPSYWFLGLFQGLNGSTVPVFLSLERRAWIALAIAVFGAGAALLLAYFRTLRKIVEEPDIVPSTQGVHWSPRFGASLQTAIVLFSIRSLLRSRQHRVVLAFYLGIGFAIALSCLKIPAARQYLLSAPLYSVSLRFLISTIVMMSFSVAGIRVAFSLPISLPASWIFRITEIRRPPAYLVATRRSLLILAVAPVLAGSAVLSLLFHPWPQAAVHLLVLGLIGIIFAELSLLGF